MTNESDYELVNRSSLSSTAGLAPAASVVGSSNLTYGQCVQALRVNTEAAATHLGLTVRTLEKWRATWRHAQQTGMADLCRGPKFFKIGNRVLYDLRDLEVFLSAHEVRVDRKA